MRDFGQYYALNTTKRICGIQLIITDAPVTTIAQTRQPVLAFDSEMGRFKGAIIIKCNATSETKSDNYTLSMGYSWFKNGIYWNLSKSSILNSTDIDLSYNDDVIYCVTTDDPGCMTALQDLNSSSTLNTIKTDSRCENVLGISNKFTIRVEYGPYNVSLHPRSDNVTVVIGNTLSVNCTSECNPPCNISWYKDDVMLSNQKQLNILVRNISNNGEYECRASNKHGATNKSLIVKLENVTVDEGVASVVDSIPLVVVYIVIPIFIIIALIIILIVVYCKKKTKSNKKSEKMKDTAELNADIPLVTYNRPPTNRPENNNRENLIYADLQLACPQRNIVHSHSGDRVIYDKIDFSKMAPTLNLL
ncbi:uncharacterized protein LOC126829278 isoform X1 [Patella vulgata]|uniref:uncharacterized protein LOC126829278 isoform X1 n=1 Tax=Patella vulgata TaxID=6465 RepID=UPI0024A8CDA3|nr:uncharacterized protein LOC126829278 isoform X1 [Patella vulgata]